MPGLVKARGKAKFAYNVLGIHAYRAEATKPIPAGNDQVRMDFACDGGGVGKRGTATLCCGGAGLSHGASRLGLGREVVGPSRQAS